MQDMALDTMTQRCARLLWEGYKAAGEKEVVQLDGGVADDAEMPAGTPVHHACTHQLEYAIGAVVEEPVRGSRIAGATYYRITDRGFALLREAGYLPDSALR
jgi:hypothetical protein